MAVAVNEGATALLRKFPVKLGQGFALGDPKAAILLKWVYKK